MRKGILAAGNWIIDQIKVIDTYPNQETLANISEQFSSNGGCAYNVLKDLFMLGSDFPLEAIGVVGADGNGDIIIDDCQRMGINITQLQKTSTAATSYTDVMSVASTGKRTFFHQRGANALLAKDHFDFSKSNSKIFHLGYLLLLNSLDKVEENGLTGAAEVLQKAKEQGFITAADLVSEDSYRFKTVVPPSLPFIDYLFINEFELGRLTGAKTVVNHIIQVQNCFAAAEGLLEQGVCQWVIVHFPDGALAVNKSGERLYQGTVAIEAAQIIGAVGAGDAFAAGLLMGVHDGWEMKESL